MADDQVADLGRQVASGERKLAFDSRWGYLVAVLDALDIPLSSQVLVFSKTSAQFHWISPSNPRAIYFNDESYVAWVPGAPFLELSTATSSGGAAFYTLRQAPVAKPALVRDDGSCLQCHESHRTLNVPGHLTRSVYPAGDGLPHFGHGTVNVDHRTPLSIRWGGWFVTGQTPFPHRGNATGPGDRFEEFSAGNRARSPRAFFNPDRYPVPHSDVVAHLVLSHQTRMHNAIARAGTEARRAIEYGEEMERLFGEVSQSAKASIERRIRRPAEALVRDLLLAGEAAIPGPVRGDSTFTDDFQKRGVRDSHGRSLRELDLESRLFRYSCSFLIRSAALANLPARVRRYVSERITSVLDGRDPEDFAHLDERARRSLREQLSGLLSDL